MGYSIKTEKSGRINSSRQTKKAEEKSRHPIFIGVADHTPLGPVWVAMTDRGLAAVRIGGEEEAFADRIASRLKSHTIQDITRTADAVCQITEYLTGTRQQFELAIDWLGMTAFQKTVLHAVADLPYGRVATYSEIARIIGKPGAARAVGRANATNPIPLVIPCHRLIGADGNLRGYGAPGGTTTKAWLLKLEKDNLS